jgi:polar amino acid transport system substrate-binding protein
VNVDRAVVAIIAFGLNFAAYAGEIFRAASRGIDRDRAEAASRWASQVQHLLHIVLPQTVHGSCPVYKGEFISLVKMTSIVGYIAVQTSPRRATSSAAAPSTPFFRWS